MNELERQAALDEALEHLQRIGSMMRQVEHELRRFMERLEGVVGELPPPGEREWSLRS